MVVLALLVFLGIFVTVVVAEKCKDSTRLAVAVSIQFFVVIFLVVCLATPVKWGEVKLDTEYDLMPISTNDEEKCYAVMNEGSYTFYLDNNKPITINTSNVSSVVYISENETPRISKYIQKSKWTWYAPPMRDDRVTYVVYLPEGSIDY